MTEIRIGTRRSKLAMWQANHVKATLEAHHPEQSFTLEEITTEGDRILDKPLVEIGGKGLFTLELERALLAGDIDLAVHSLKDLPTDLDPAFALGAVPERELPFDALVSREGQPFADLPQGATIGTSSLRRRAQMLAVRADLHVESIRGNVDTRLRKAHDPDGPYDAIVLAQAGLKRLALDEHITEVLALSVMLPAPGQGALGIQCRAGDERILSVLAPLNHEATALAVAAERAFLNELEAGCRLPVAGYATLTGDDLTLRGRIGSLDGQTVIEVARSLPALSMAPHLRHSFADKLGRDAAREAISQGADVLIQAVKEGISE